MAYYPSQPPINASQEEIQSWLWEEFNRLAEALEDGLSHITLEPQLNTPIKYTNGTIVNLSEGASDSFGNNYSAGLYVFRDNLWRKLVEEV